MVEQEETWKDITDYEGFYQVSSLGKVKSLDRYRTDKKGFSKFLPSVVLKLGRGTHGYLSCVICKDCKPKTKTVHRLVAIHFLDKVDGKEFVNHIDGNKLNNHASNLEWVTSSENTIHGLSLGIMNTAKGIQKPNTKLDEAKVLSIKKRLLSGHRMTDIAKDFSVSSTNIQAIKENKTWKYVTI